ncbi:fumarylacetoacetate hydrolase [Aspergillus sclerotioniger CBS 115572]|uniref:Fumarylacetoacetase n=1 Tax=Aspergillus sclerotioniger CBS 115572 TaxID=1450535 RepID=A0A317W1R9_9EURO|nr:fumarylacetoacetate hydrolase [Aspergillus sclerotioniger CBS 115572]PWY80423.1 fumarylacetoacetate hydrolase [Aspergillus sclerotioniger CBS 115572]
MHLPVSIPSFTDYSSSLPHNQHAGLAILNNPTPPPAFFHFPIGYSGRASTIIVSGTPITRPVGHFYDRTSASSSKEVIFAPTRALDYELELGVVVGRPLAPGKGLDARDAEGHIFGLVVVNDWSARDIQGLEMIPLGPLNGKNFATTISPWIVTLDALEPFKAKGPEPRVSLPRHLVDPGKASYDISVLVEVEEGEGGRGKTVLGRSNAREFFWSVRQMCAHLASTGCDLRTGDLLGTGTVSGDGEGEYGCLLEVTKGARWRVYLEDGDVVTLSAWAGEGVGFGECVGQVRPAREGWSRGGDNPIE